ncbi:MAG: MBL fold metallo-hydrolase [Betaproteobacteria bacterium]|nr:MBL fold metallo-hydrolase [Betaproteobacteria bacterium]
MLLQLFDAPSSTYTYILADETTREAAIIDPVLGRADRDLAELARHGLSLRWILDTHVHADHETGANALKTATGAGTAVGALCGSVGHDCALEDGELLPLGGDAIRVIATPGHTPGSMSFLWRGQVFTGDALLIEGCGRTDFQNGSSDQLYRSITERLFTLPEHTVVWPGHDYRFRASSTIGHEKRHNPRLANKSREQFCDLMAALKLAPPAQIEQAVPANRHGGALQSGEAVPAMLMAREVEREFDAARDALVDLRDEADFAADSLPSAIRVDGSDIERLAGIARTHRKLFLICRSGRRSLVATDALAKAGIGNVWNVTGGMLALRANSAVALEAHEVRS